MKKGVGGNINVDWIGKNQETLSRNSGRAVIDYGKTIKITFRPETKVMADYTLVEVKLDECLMYQNILNVGRFEIV